MNIYLYYALIILGACLFAAFSHRRNNKQQFVSTEEIIKAIVRKNRQSYSKRKSK